MFRTLPPRRTNENQVQAAVQGSLEVFCQDRNLELLPPYPNQQGFEQRKFCVDLLGMMDDSDIILLEFKVLDCTSGRLQAFDDDQHASAVQFEDLGVPLAYAYNRVPKLAYHHKPKPPAWAERTLKEVNRAAPSELPHVSPTVPVHESLYDWLNRPHGTSAASLVGRVHGAVQSANDLRNGVLLLLYGVGEQKLASLEPEELLKVVALLQRESALTARQIQKVNDILDGSNDVFNRFLRPGGSTPPGPKLRP